MFYFDEIFGKKVLKSDLLKNVEHFFTTRESVIKTKDIEFEDLVLENKKIICDYLNIPLNNLITPSQTHTNNVEIVEKTKTSYPNTDGLILNNFEDAIFLNFADCTPLVFYDKRLNIGTVSHAGWRGTAGKIGPVTVEKMIKEFGSNPSDIQALIGPAISMCCYNVGDEVLDKLRATVNDFSGLSEVRDGEIFVDLKNINRQQLIEIGVKEIDVCPYCTVCDNDMFFSYRKENATTNRHSAVLKLIKNS